MKIGDLIYVKYDERFKVSDYIIKIDEINRKDTFKHNFRIKGKLIWCNGELSEAINDGYYSLFDIYTIYNKDYKVNEILMLEGL